MRADLILFAYLVEMLMADYLRSSEVKSSGKGALEPTLYSLLSLPTTVYFNTSCFPQARQLFGDTDRVDTIKLLVFRLKS